MKDPIVAEIKSIAAWVPVTPLFAKDSACGYSFNSSVLLYTVHTDYQQS